MKEAPSFEGAFLIPATPPSGRHRGWVLVTVGVWLAGPTAVLTMGCQGFFGNTELSLELWTVISGISGLHDWDTDRTPSNVVTDYRVSLQSVTMWLRSPKEKFGFELV